MTRVEILSVLASMILLSGCGGDDAKPAGTDFRVSGTVLQDVGGGATPSGLSGAAVTVAVDADGDGRMNDGDAASAMTDGDGNYSLTVSLASAAKIVVRLESDGFATLVRTLEAAPGGELPLSATLKPLEELDCDNGRCALGSGAVVVKGLPAGLSGEARIFNPVAEADSFPGDFADDGGDLLISGVFATFAMKDDGGNEVSELDAPATVSMRMPRDTWGVIVDIVPGNDRIDVPLYSFDETEGTWVRDGQGHLEDSEGAVLPESSLAGIKDGSYSGVVLAVGDVTHFSTWNVDWPVETHGCVTGRVVTADGSPAVGATVTLRGVTYTGTSQGQTVGADGTFCIEAMRSEAPGEDVDNDGITGETQQVAIRAAYRGKVYDLGTFDMSQAQAACGEDGCEDLGDLPLSDENVLTAGLCTVTGTVRDMTGAVVADAAVYGWDDSVDADIWEALCIDSTTYQFNCDFGVISAADGSFTLTTASMDAVTLFGMWSDTLSAAEQIYMDGERTVSGCPTQPVTLTLAEGFISVTPTVTVTNQTISWSPSNYSAYFVEVADASNYKWLIYDDASGIDGPVTYGVVPAGATQGYPYTGAPPASLASGDEISVGLSGTTADGLPYFGWGVYTLP